MRLPGLMASVAAIVGSQAAAAQTQDTTSSPVKISGYVTSSYFLATKPTGGAIVGRLYDRFNDRFIANGARISITKPVNTDKLEAGFQVDAVFGENAAVLHSAGLSLGDQGDLPQAFAVLNVPTGGGTYVQFKAGKLWTLLDVEVVDEILNPNFSHGYQYIYATNFTHTGLGIDAQLSKSVDAHLHLINGWDVVQDNNKAKSVMGRLGITTSPKVALAFFGYFGPEQTDNTSNSRYGGEFVGTFKPASTTTLYAQFDVGAEDGLGPNGGKAHWWAAGAWGAFDLSPKASLALRADYLDDQDGVRTSGVLGFSAVPSRRMVSGTATLNIKTWEHALVRPELRFEHSSRNDFGNLGSLSNGQLTLGVAVSYIF